MLFVFGKMLRISRGSESQWGKEMSWIFSALLKGFRLLLQSSDLYPWINTPQGIDVIAI